MATDPETVLPDTPDTAAVADLTPPESTELSAEAIESSTPFVGRWNELVSTTNWEKGRIISDWRDALKKAEAHVTEYSDEAWARLVGGVTSQHVGRLRRAHERFGAAREQYPGLYWSHFQAALDWDDSEMWLEGAITNNWSVSQMRGARWEAVGGVGEPTDGQVIEAQIDEDAYNALADRPANEAAAEGGGGSGEHFDTADSGEPRERNESVDDDSEAPFDVPSETAEAMPRIRPFEDLAALPDDVAEAFEQFKLVILSHKLSGWDTIPRDDLLGVLESLKVLAMAPSADE